MPLAEPLHMHYFVGRQSCGCSIMTGAEQLLEVQYSPQRSTTMSKEKSSKKEEKKKPAMTQKEKKAAKKSKNESSDFSINDKKK
jgi:hypothetical protein